MIKHSQRNVTTNNNRLEHRITQRNGYERRTNKRAKGIVQQIRFREFHRNPEHNNDQKCLETTIGFMIHEITILNLNKT